MSAQEVYVYQQVREHLLDYATMLSNGELASVLRAIADEIEEEEREAEGE